MAEVDDLQAQILQLQQSNAQLRGGGQPSGGPQSPMEYGAVPLPGGGGQPMPPMQGAPQGGMTPSQMQSVFGLLAGGSDDPSQVGQAYVTAMQNQQRINQDEGPMSQYMKMFGVVNPGEYDPDSLEVFRKDLAETGTPNYSLLDRRITRQGEEAMLAAQTEANDSGIRANRMRNLETRYQQAAAQGVIGGVPTTIGNFWRSMGGAQNELDQLQAEYNQLRGAGVMAALPPGAASDADVALAKSGWPAGNSDPAYLAQFLRGMRKLATIDQAYNDERARYIADKNDAGGFTDHWKEQGDGVIGQYFSGQGLQYYQAPEGMDAETARAARFQSYFDTSGNMGATNQTNPMATPGGGSLPPNASTDDLVAAARGMQPAAAPQPNALPPELRQQIEQRLAQPPPGAQPGGPQQLGGVPMDELRRIGGLLQ